MTLDQVLESDLYSKESTDPAVDFLAASVIRILRNLSRKPPKDRNAQEERAASSLFQVQTRNGQQEVSARELIFPIYEHFKVLIPYQYIRNVQKQPIDNKNP